MDLLSDYQDEGDAFDPTALVEGEEENNGEGEGDSSHSSLSLGIKRKFVAKPVQVAPHVLGVTGKKAYYQKPGDLVVYHNPTVEALYAPLQGPSRRPDITVDDEFQKNCWNGFLEKEHIDDVIFDQQFHNFENKGSAENPSYSNLKGKKGILTTSNPRWGTMGPMSVIGWEEKRESEKTQNDGEDAPTEEREPSEKTEREETVGGGEGGKRKRKRRDREREDPGSENYLGPWRPPPELEVYKVPEPTAEMLEEYKKKQEVKEAEKKKDEMTFEESTVFHGKELKDYQGRSYVDIPNELTAKIGKEHECYLPKKPIHTWTGHTKGVSAIQFFPKSGHLLLSASMDTKVKIWDVYNKRQCMRTYMGHTGAVRAIDFSPDGKTFLSGSFDKSIKLWDTETGECIGRYTNKSIPYCVKFAPTSPNEFVAACSNKKIVQWDIRTKEITQEYDRHLMAVNTVLFIDDGRRFISTSDDKTIRIWEFGIPVDIKLIQEPHMHSMPSVALHPKQKYFATQSLDNQILIYGAQNRFSLNKRKRFAGHMTSGYACQVNFSPDCSYVISGSAGGSVFIWDWKTCRILKKLKAHDKVCIGCEWHPVEPSRLATCGWDGLIKYWD